MRISDWSSDVCSSDLSRSVGVRRFDDPDLSCLRQRKQVEYSVGRLMPPGRPLPDRFHALDIPTRRDLFDPDFLAAADLWLCLFRHRAWIVPESRIDGGCVGLADKIGRAPD